MIATELPSVNRNSRPHSHPNTRRSNQLRCTAFAFLSAATHLSSWTLTCRACRRCLPKRYRSTILASKGVNVGLA